jgi:hypothetical protein
MIVGESLAAQLFVQPDVCHAMRAKCWLTQFVNAVIELLSPSNKFCEIYPLRQFNPESAAKEPSRHERGVIRSAMLTTGLAQRRHGTVQVHSIFPLYHPVIVDLEIRTQVPTHEGPLRGCSLLDSLRNARFPFFMPSPTSESRNVEASPRWVPILHKLSVYQHRGYQLAENSHAFGGIESPGLCPLQYVRLASQL